MLLGAVVSSEQHGLQKPAFFVRTVIQSCPIKWCREERPPGNIYFGTLQECHHFGRMLDTFTTLSPLSSWHWPGWVRGKVFRFRYSMVLFATQRSGLQGVNSAQKNRASSCCCHCSLVDPSTPPSFLHKITGSTSTDCLMAQHHLIGGRFTTNAWPKSVWSAMITASKAPSWQAKAIPHPMAGSSWHPRQPILRVLIHGLGYSMVQYCRWY